MTNGTIDPSTVAAIKHLTQIVDLGHYFYRNIFVRVILRWNTKTALSISNSISYPVKKDEVEAARESCMEEECERVEAEIAKDRVRNENRMLKVNTYICYVTE